MTKSIKVFIRDAELDTNIKVEFPGGLFLKDMLGETFHKLYNIKDHLLTLNEDYYIKSLTTSGGTNLLKLKAK